MLWRRDNLDLDARVAALDKELGGLRVPGGTPVAAAVERWRADAAALRFHLRDDGAPPRVVAVLGGTGTGKSTLVNRLLGRTVSAASFRRTFTAGAVAVARAARDVPATWLGIDHAVAAPEQLPARGAPDLLVIVPAEHELTRAVTLIDTPDLDGDQPLHHAQADRAFRWAHAVVFVVTPEKYQMTELLPYYRLARRYAVPALFVMNKAEQPAVLVDYAAQLARHATNGADDRGGPREPADREVPVFAVPRDDAGYEPPADANLDALRAALVSLGSHKVDAAGRAAGVANRAADLRGRLVDQVVAPLRDARREADRLSVALRAMESPSAGVDVNPLTRQLQRRLQQRSILYLMGPQRMIDRVRQVPGLLVRLPRTAWDLVMKGQVDPAATADPTGEGATGSRQVPDFAAALAEQFAVVQSRIEDVLRTSPAGEAWVADASSGWADAKLDPAAAGAIATEELADLRAWLEKRWNATPRDTMLLNKLLKHLPGGERLTRWSEAAPYLLTIVVATHHAFFGHIDLMIIGGYTLATWLTERLSNEVASRTRLANRRIAERFERLCHDQITRATTWLDSRAPSAVALERLGRMADELGG